MRKKELPHFNRLTGPVEGGCKATETDVGG